MDSMKNTLNKDNDKDSELIWEEVSVNHLVTDEFIDFREVDYRLPDGKIGPPFYNYSRKDYVVVLASDENGRFVCVKQFRHGIREVTTEFPAGGIEADTLAPYAKSGRDPKWFDAALDAARRELKEETGYVSDDWEHMITVPSNATMADNYAFIYRARNCRLESNQILDDTEFINVYLYTANELEELIKKGSFQQAMHIMAWEMSKNRG